MVEVNTGTRRRICVLRYTPSVTENLRLLRGDSQGINPSNSMVLLHILRYQACENWPKCPLFEPALLITRHWRRFFLRMPQYRRTCTGKLTLFFLHASKSAILPEFFQGFAIHQILCLSLHLHNSLKQQRLCSCLVFCQRFLFLLCSDPLSFADGKTQKDGPNASLPSKFLVPKFFYQFLALPIPHWNQYDVSPILVTTYLTL